MGILQKPARSTVIHDLYRFGLIHSRARDSALNLILPPRAWWKWADRILLFLGSALVLAGIVFFIAYNWADLGRFTKFGLIEVGLVLGLILARQLNYHSLAGKVLLLAVCILTGCLLAVYGQVYQTGADAFELFTAWAVLILGWVLVSEFGALWIIWLAVVNTGVILYWKQVARPNHNLDYQALCLALFVLNALALAGKEIGWLKGRMWLSGVWMRYVLLLALLTGLTIPTVEFIVEPAARNFFGFLSLLAWLGSVPAIFGLYRHLWPDLPALALLALAVCLVLLSALAKALFDISTAAWMYLLFGLIIIGVISLATIWLRHLNRTGME